jgi:two-component system, OmpR family, osmolarity sensor histidine kinase EnvZ
MAYWWAKLKPKSAVWRTTLVISIVVLFSQYLSLAFFWWNLYLPEMRQHAHYVAVNLSLLRNAEDDVLQNPQALEMQAWVEKATASRLCVILKNFPH